MTEVLAEVGLIDSRFFTPESAERGRQIHIACQYLAEERLDWTDLDPRIEPYVRSYEKFLQSSRWIMQAVERKVYDQVLGICGTYDVTFVPVWLIDLKAGVPAKWHKAQIGAYWHLNGRRGGNTGCLYLQSDGSIAKLIPHNAYEGWREFQVALNFLRLKESYA